jgi:hypothetical protein
VRERETVCGGGGRVGVWIWRSCQKVEIVMGVEKGLQKYKLPSKDWKFSLNDARERGSQKLYQRDLYILTLPIRAQKYTSLAIVFVLHWQWGPRNMFYHHVYYTLSTSSDC